MLLWSWKLFRMFKTAVAGRQHPTQLAWAIGLGIWLGMIPHGNLIALALGLLILSVRVNHAAATLTTVAVTLMASYADGLFHLVGDRLLSLDSMRGGLATAWQYPLVPWTDLNNTVMLGSFAVGAVILVPVVYLLLPLCRFWAGTTEDQPVIGPSILEAPVFEEIPAAAMREAKTVERLEPAHVDVPPPHRSQPHSRPLTLVGAGADRVDDADHARFQGLLPGSPRPQGQRLATPEPQPTPSKPASRSTDSNPNEQLQIDEALNYLLRQLRDSYDKDAA